MPGINLEVIFSRFSGGISMKSTMKSAMNGNTAEETTKVRTAAGRLRKKLSWIGVGYGSKSSTTGG